MSEESLHESFKVRYWVFRTTFNAFVWENIERVVKWLTFLYLLFNKKLKVSVEEIKR